MARSKHGCDEDRFAGKVALVTGAASGLGRALAIELAKAGSDLVAVDVDEQGLGQTASMVESVGSRCMARRVDVSSRSEMEGLAADVLGDWGRVDVLVNNAGVGVGGELKDIPLDDFEWIVGINLMGEVYGTRLFLPQMVERGSGHIVNVSSLSGLVLLPFHIPYTTTKFGLYGFTEALWAETRRFGIGVTVVCPGAIRTNIMANTRVSAATAGEEAFGDRWKGLLDRAGKEPDEVARMVLRAVERGRFLVLTGPEAYLFYYLRRLAPGMMRSIVAAVTARTAAR
jgi:NAD(P)-dependent dehydrogenase (short-subunit alcohol dehydrogenase family)